MNLGAAAFALLSLFALARGAPDICSCGQAISDVCRCYRDGWMDCFAVGLTRIPGDLPACSKMLSLGNNSITHIDSSNLRGLTNLQDVLLENNNIAVIDVGAFVDLKNATTLNLSNNRLTTVDKCTFQGLVALTKLYLGGNRITQIADRAFDGLTSIQFLSIADNSLTSFSAEWFRNKPSLLFLPDKGNVWNCTCQLRAQHQLAKSFASLLEHCPALPSLAGSFCITCSGSGQLAGKSLATATDADFAHCTEATTTTAEATTGVQATTTKTKLSTWDFTGVTSPFEFDAGEAYCDTFVAKRLSLATQTAVTGNATLSTSTATESTTKHNVVTKTTQNIAETTGTTVSAASTFSDATVTLSHYQGLAPWAIALVVLAVVCMIVLIAVVIALLVRTSGTKRPATGTDTTTNGTREENEVFNAKPDVRL